MAIGQLMLDLEGQTLTVEEVEVLKHPQVGGVIYFSRNYESPEQISALSESIRRVRPELLIAVDQEGGRVQRFCKGFTRIPAMQNFLPLFRKDPQDAIYWLKNTGWLMASELLATGVDLSFAPVLDTDDQYCSVIADRSFSSVPAEVSVLAGAFIDGMHEAGMAATGKHFPGHGSVSGDSHLQLPEDHRSLPEISAHDMLPFVELGPRLDAIMPAHISFPSVDDKYPVGFSTYWLKTVLRKHLRFPGAIFSDDLSMAGAAIIGNYAERSKRALVAGCDMILVCNHRQGALQALAALPMSPNVQSSERLQKMKSRKKISLRQLQASERWFTTRQFLECMTSN
ncbi:MAG: beta-N-acetylhexosaminidase [Cellvibrionaceae bacterium]|jgi:beta-N-acetylhexosaminidase